MYYLVLPETSMYSLNQLPRLLNLFSCENVLGMGLSTVNSSLVLLLSG